MEQLQYESPGELGKLMGLDRVPEVRCLRQKLTQLNQGKDNKAAEVWAGLLSKDWMEQEPELAGTLNWEQLDDEVKSAVERLRPEHRATLLLWSIEGLSYKEIAEVCECALGTVMSRLYRARRLLGRDLQGYAKERKWPNKRFE